MDKAQIKETIIKAIKEVQDKGYTLIRGCYYDETEQGKFVCALGSVLVANSKKTYDVSPQIQEMFGVDYIWVNDFVQSYDGNAAAWHSKYQEAKELAEEIIKEFNPPVYNGWEKAPLIKEVKIEEPPKEEAKEEEVK